MGNEDFQVIQQFLDEYNEETGENKTIVDKGPATPSVPSEPANKPALQVLQGGKGKSGVVSNVTTLPTLDDLPTPAGISFLLFFILFILFAVTPVQGTTRLGLAWKAILGKVGWASDTSTNPMPAGPAAYGVPSGYSDPTTGYTLDYTNWMQ